MLRITLMALGVITLLYAGNVILIFGVLGVEQTVLQKWPLINYLRVGMLPFCNGLIPWSFSFGLPKLLRWRPLNILPAPLPWLP